MNCSSCRTSIDQSIDHFHLTYFGGGADALDVEEWFCSVDCIRSRILI
jgi:hypothetical protein